MNELRERTDRTRGLIEAADVYQYFAELLRDDGHTATPEYGQCRILSAMNFFIAAYEYCGIASHAMTAAESRDADHAQVLNGIARQAYACAEEARARGMLVAPSVQGSGHSHEQRAGDAGEFSGASTQRLQMQSPRSSSDRVQDLFALVKNASEDGNAAKAIGHLDEVARIFCEFVGHRLSSRSSARCMDLTSASHKRQLTEVDSPKPDTPSTKRPRPPLPTSPATRSPRLSKSVL